jgi:hypothetical protein
MARQKNKFSNYKEIEKSINVFISYKMVHIMLGLNESEHRHGIEYQKGLDQNQTRTMNNEKKKLS